MVDDGVPWFVVLGLIGLVAVIFGLGRIAIVSSERKDAEKQRGDTLQQGLNALRDRSKEDQKFFEEERNFFEILKAFVTASNVEERKALLDELRNFTFSPPPTTTTTTAKTTKSTTTTTTTSNPSVTPAPPPPSTTTTTRAPPPPPPPGRTCVTTPVINVCPLTTASSNERKSA